MSEDRKAVSVNAEHLSDKVEDVLVNAVRGAGRTARAMFQTLIDEIVYRDEQIKVYASEQAKIDTLLTEKACINTDGTNAQRLAEYIEITDAVSEEKDATIVTLKERIRELKDVAVSDNE